MANPFSPVPIDFSMLAQLPQLYQQGQQVARENALRRAFSGGVPMQGGMPDYQAIANLQAQSGNPAAAIETMNQMPQYKFGEITKPAFGSPGVLGFQPPRPGMPVLDESGKPIDPSTLQQDAMSDILLDDNTAWKMSRQAKAGDYSVFTNLGRGAIAAQNSKKIRQFMYQDQPPSGVTDTGGTAPTDISAAHQEYKGLGASETWLGRRSAQIDYGIEESRKMIPLVIEASKLVNRSQYKSLNEITNAIARGTGDPNIVRLDQAINGLVNVYARTIAPTGVPTDSDKGHARQVLDAAFSEGQIEAGVDQLLKEMQAAQAAPPQVQKNLRANFSGQQQGSLTAGTVVGGYTYLGGNPNDQSSWRANQ